MALADAEGFTFGLSYSDPLEAVAPKHCNNISTDFIAYSHQKQSDHLFDYSTEHLIDAQARALSEQWKLY